MRRFAERYFAERQAGRIAEAMDMFADGLVEDRAAWTRNFAETDRKLGKGARRVSAVTWYVNPPTAPQAGIFAAVDFVGDYPAAHLYCGYIGVVRRGPGTYEIVRQEENVFARRDGEIGAARLQEMRAALCREQ